MQRMSIDRATVDRTYMGDGNTDQNDCKYCYGTGYHDLELDVPCHWCSGTGKSKKRVPKFSKGGKRSHKKQVFPLPLVIQEITDEADEGD